MATCRKHPDLVRALEHERAEKKKAQETLRRTVAALDRYGRHLRGCRFTRTYARCRCTCGYHDRLREGGINP